MLFDLLYIFVLGMFYVIFGSFIVRMIFSWIAPDSDNPIYRAAYFLTEIFVAPVRIFMEKNNILTDFPIDMSYLFGYFLYVILFTVLTGVGSMI